MGIQRKSCRGFHCTPPRFLEEKLRVLLLFLFLVKITRVKRTMSVGEEISEVSIQPTLFLGPPKGLCDILKEIIGIRSARETNSQRFWNGGSGTFPNKSKEFAAYLGGQGTRFPAKNLKIVRVKISKFSKLFFAA